MYGWRGRIGAIVPASNTTMEPELRRLCPEGVEVYATRLAFEPKVAGLRHFKDDAARAALELSSEGLSQVIVFGCTVGSMIGGQGTDEEINEVIRSNSGVQAVTATTAVLEACRALGVTSLAVATPYTEAINRVEGACLEALGLTVVSIAGCHAEVPDEAFTNAMIGRLSPEQTYRFARGCDRPEAQALFISCTNLRTVEIMGALERDLGKPVLSSNLCTMWAALQRLGLRYDCRDLGSRCPDTRLTRNLFEPTGS